MTGELLVLRRGFVRAMLGIETRAGQSKALHRAAMNQVLGDDLIDVFQVNEPIPDGLGIDHNDGAVLALVKTAGLIGADLVLEAGVLDRVLEGRFELLAAVGKAAWTGGRFVALVGADKEMVFKFRHGEDFLLCPVLQRRIVRAAQLSETI